MFHKGDLIRRRVGTKSWGIAVEGEIYTVREQLYGYDTDRLKLEGCDLTYKASNFDPVVYCTPAEMFETLDYFVKVILSPTPLRVGDVYCYNGTLSREVLAIHGDFVWMTGTDGPHTMKAIRLQNYVRTHVGPA